MDYEHDIFISYRSECPTTDWMVKVFLPELKKCLIPRRTKGINIFDDSQVRVGSEWSKLLHKKVAVSRLLLPMLTPYYFGSDWCRLELALMMEREEKLGLRSTIERSELGLVIPIRLFDGEKFPKRINDIQLGNFREYTNVRRGTREWGKFLKSVDALADAIDEILDSVPAFDTSWVEFTGKSIEPQLQITSNRQTTLLRLIDR